MVGRGTRTYPDKADCLVLDVVGVTKRHSVMTASEIFDLDLRSRSVKEAMEYQKQRERILAMREADIIDGELVAHQVDLFGGRPMHWVQTRQGAWVLNLGNGFVRLTPAEGDVWDVHYLENGGPAGLLQSGIPLGYAQGMAEDFARKRGAGRLLDPDTRWRGEPASEKQINWLKRKRCPVPRGLTKGEASDLITALNG
jgi:hypothetical protein